MVEVLYGTEENGVYLDPRCPECSRFMKRSKKINFRMNLDGEIIEVNPPFVCKAHGIQMPRVTMNNLDE